MLRALSRSPLLLLIRNCPNTTQQTSLSTSSSSVWRWFATENKPSSPHQQQQQQPNEQANATANDDNKPSDSSSSAQASVQSDGSPESAASGAPLSDIEQLQQQLAEKDAHIAELNDRALRALAEMENVRMIARRDVDNTRKYAAVPFAKSILGVADNLGLALGSVDQKLIDGDDASVDPLFKGLFVGVQATEAELLKVFAQHGITRYGAVGDKFDPNKYQAMFEAPSPDHEPGTVINVQKLGYEMEDRVLRPAEVGVSKAP